MAPGNVAAPGEAERDPPATMKARKFRPARVTPVSPAMPACAVMITAAPRLFTEASRAV
jgi:hypothetical protein